VRGETFVFTQFSGQPQCFLTDAELLGELADQGFGPDPFLPIREYNRPSPGALITVSGPVIYEAGYRLRKAQGNLVIW
jgi:hypothetical protein